MSARIIGRRTQGDGRAGYFQVEGSGKALGEVPFELGLEGGLGCQQRW